MEKLETGDRDISTETMAAMLRELPQYKEYMQKYVFHLNLCDDLDRELRGRSGVLLRVVSVCISRGNLFGLGCAFGAGTC